MTEFQVLGITLKDYSVRESMRKVETYLNDGKVSAICYITAGGILEAESHPETRAFLEDMDLTIPADTDILKTVGITARYRFREVAGNDFLRLFLQKVSKNGDGVVLLSDTSENTDKLEKSISDRDSGIKIVGKFALNDLKNDEEGLINDINVLAPTVIISTLSYPDREEFFKEHHMKLHAEVWLILPGNMIFTDKKPGIAGRIKAFFENKALKKTLDQYNREEESAEESAKDEALKGTEEGVKQPEGEKIREFLKFNTQEIDTDKVNKAVEND